MSLHDEIFPVDIAESDAFRSFLSKHRSRNFQQPLADRFTSDLRGLTIEVGRRRRRGRRCIGDPQRVGRMNLDHRDIQPKNGGRDLCHFGIYALTHFDRTSRHRDAAVGVNVDERACLIHRRFCERDAKTDRHQSDALFEIFRRRVKFVRFQPQGRKIETGVSLRPRRGRLALGQLSVRELVAVLEQIRPLDLGSGHTELISGVCDRRFDNEHTLRTAKTAKSGIRRQIGPAAISGRRDVRDVVRVCAVKQRPFEHGR